MIVLEGVVWFDTTPWYTKPPNNPLGSVNMFDDGSAAIAMFTVDVDRREPDDEPCNRKRSLQLNFRFAKSINQ